MKTGIIYISKHGTTEKVANTIASKLNVLESDLIDLRKQKNELLKNFDKIIIGGSIHMADIHKKLKKFCVSNKHVLLTKELGLFLCCMEEGDKAIEQFENAFSEDLRKHASSIAFVGYEYNLEKMNFIERALVKMISESKESVSRIDAEAIDRFVNELRD